MSENGLTILNKDGYKARFNGEGIDYLTKSGAKRLSLTSATVTTYNKNDGNYLGGLGAVNCGVIYGNAFMASKHNAFFDFSHNPAHVYDTEVVKSGDSYLRINFYDYNYDGSSSAPYDCTKGVEVNKVPLRVNNNLYVSNNLHVTQDTQLWGDLKSEGNIDTKRITCRSGIDMKNMSVENAYAIKFKSGTGCLVKGDGYKLELGGTSSGDAGGTKIGIADSYGNISDTLWISSYNFAWNKADWNWGGKNIYDVNVYGSYAVKALNNEANAVSENQSIIDEIQIVEPLNDEQAKIIDVSNVSNKKEILIDEKNVDLSKLVTVMLEEIKRLKNEIENLKG